MAVIQEVKELPKKETVLRKWVYYDLIVCMATAIAVIIWYSIRYNKAHDDDSYSTPMSILHIIGYVAYAVVTGIAMYGTHSQNKKFLWWFVIGCLAVIVGEIVCFFINIVISRESHKYGIIVYVLKVLVLLVVIVSAILVYLLIRFIQKSVPSDIEKADNIKPPATATAANQPPASATAKQLPPPAQTAATNKHKA
ncbi:uncharacterized protein LOC128959114 [Oppia nitens]|uniref:uncharacterized protein LOC128959114 n=1 Tax=Oppia nitens TaxID=1686743 RepID=UPI0023DA4D80|nr:uncharacterized protein LOC128959114 [Oppia nitens]